MTAEPPLEIRHPAASGPPDRMTAELGRWAVGAVVGLLAVAAVLIGWRRLATALEAPLEPAVLVSVGVLLAGVAAGVRVAWQRVWPESRSRRLDWLIVVLPSVAVLGLGAALSLPRTQAAALAVFWFFLAGEECWAWHRATRRRGTEASSAVRPVRLDPPQAPSPHPAPPELMPAELPATLLPAVPAENVLQQLTRSQAADGSQSLSGWLRTTFAAGQRTTSVHVAFCPPFRRTPELAVQQLDGPPARIKTAQLLPYGARLDLKLSVVAEKPGSVLLEFSARSKGEE